MAGKKPIGLWSAISIGVGGMIGAGIFSILGTACQIGGNAVYISFIIAGIAALFSTYSYAKLGVKYPSAGGPVEFLLRGLGDGILSGGFNLLLWLGYVLALALYAKAFAAYALTFFPGLQSYWLAVFAVGVIVFFTAVNFKGARAVGNSELFIVTVKIGILILFAIAGFLFIDPGKLSPVLWPKANNVFFAAAVVFLAYEGFGLITNAAEDMKEPKKTLPLALYLSVLIVIAIYVSVSLAVVGNLSIPEIIKAKDYALAEAAMPFLGVIGFKIIAFAALFSTASAINATLYGGANVSYMLARIGELPDVFERKAWGSNVEGLFMTSGLVILFSLFLELSAIAMVGSAAFLLIYAAVNFSHWRLRKETGANPFIILLSVFSCALSFLVLAFYLLSEAPLTLAMLAVLMLASFGGEWLYRKRTLRVLKPRENTQLI